MGSETTYFDFDGTNFVLQGADFLCRDGNVIKIASDPTKGDIKFITSPTSTVPNTVIGSIGFSLEIATGKACPLLYFAHEDIMKPIAVLRNDGLSFYTGLKEMRIDSDGLSLGDMFEVRSTGILLAAPTQITGTFTAPNDYSPGGTSTGIIKKDSNGFLKANINLFIIFVWKIKNYSYG